MRVFLALSILLLLKLVSVGVITYLEAKAVQGEVLITYVQHGVVQLNGMRLRENAKLYTRVYALPYKLGTIKIKEIEK